MKAATMPTYFEVDGIPGRYFACARYGTMTPEACGKNFAAAPRAFRLSGRLEGCLNCPVGREHCAGAPVPEAAAAPEIYYRPVCLRCRRDGKEEGSRLISRMRLVRNQTICVSCFNREREVLLGANAKGAKPKKWQLYRPQVAYVRDSRVMREAMATPVVDRTEAALTLLRQGGTGSVMWAPAPVVKLS
jgi:hypothetical protein